MVAPIASQGLITPCLATSLVRTPGKVPAPSAAALWQAQRQEHGFHIVDAPAETPTYAFVGCVPVNSTPWPSRTRFFMAGAHVDPTYAARA